MHDGDIDDDNNEADVTLVFPLGSLLKLEFPKLKKYLIIQNKK